MTMNQVFCGPVAWSDGMLIEVQHFQQFERHVGHQVDAKLAVLTNHAWGFSQLRLDVDGLSLRRLGLRSAKGVFPDGTPFFMPGNDPLPAPMDATQGRAGDVVVLAIKGARTTGPDMSFSDRHPIARYRAVSSDVIDSGVGQEDSGAPRQITMLTGALMSRLCFASEVRSDEVALEVARVAARSPSGGLILDELHIPPLLDARSHSTLQILLEELQGILRTRLSGSSGIRALSAGGGVADLLEMLLRQALAEYRLRLENLDAFDPLHPSFLFQELIGLLGRLSVLPGVEDDVFGRKYTYNHADLQGSFEPVARALRSALARVIQTPVLPLKFEDRGDGVHLCLLDKQWQLQKLIFAVSSSMPSDTLRVLLPQQAKLGSVEFIQKLIDLQLPGARLTPLPHPPRQVPYYADSVYYEVESQDPYWGQMFAGSALALRIVGQFPDLKFEAWGLREAKFN